MEGEILLLVVKSCTRLPACFRMPPSYVYQSPYLTAAAAAAATPSGLVTLPPAPLSHAAAVAAAASQFYEYQNAAAAALAASTYPATSQFANGFADPYSTPAGMSCHLREIQFLYLPKGCKLLIDYISWRTCFISLFPWTIINETWLAEISILFWERYIY